LTKTFEDLGLSQELLKAVATAGYETPTPIQQEAIPAVLQHRDVLGIAQTGTGKTASFTLPMIELLARGRARARMPRSLILTPTRELASQVADNFEKYGINHKLTMALLIGGVSFDEQDRKLDRGVDVLIATPGRLIDQFERGKVLLTGVQVLVIDEADRMLDMGFIPDIEKIVKLTPFTRQTLFFSATMPSEIERLTNTFLQNPVRIEVSRRSSTVANVKQTMVWVPSDYKLKRQALRTLLDRCEVANGIIFCNRKRDVEIVAKSLERHGYSVSALHGDLDQSVRLDTLDKFRDGKCKFLVASDVAARGLDIPAVSHVFNFDVPYPADDYVHRIGRTGRAGRSGEAYTLVTKAEDKALKAIEKQTGQQLEILELEASVREEVQAPAPKVAEPPRGGQGPVRAEDVNPDEQSAEDYKDRGDARSGQPPRRTETPSKRQRDEVVGLGDHTPAFLMRPVPDLKTKSKEYA